MNFLSPPKKRVVLRSHSTLKVPLKKGNLGQRSILFIGPSIWNKLSNNLKVLKVMKEASATMSQSYYNIL